MTHTFRIVLMAQAMISGMMAALMTGFFGLINDGPTPEFLSAWGRTFITAWPVAFCFSLIVGRVAFHLAYRLNRMLP